MTPQQLSSSSLSTRLHARLPLRWLGAVLASAMLMTTASCEAPAPTDDEAQSQPAAEEIRLSDGDSAGLFVRQRLEEVLYVELPKALATKDDFRCRKLCESAKLRVQGLVEADRVKEVEEVADAVQELCEGDVSLLVADNLLAELEEGSAADLDMRCNTGALPAAFLFDTGGDNAAVAEKRKILFEKCPMLGERWNVATKGRNEALERREDGKHVVILPHNKKK